MSVKQKRFWTSTDVKPAAGGYAIELDGRRVRTPAKAALILPNRAVADLVAAEWESQTDKIDPAKMPATRTANSAIDKVGPQHGAVVDMLAAYGDADLLCYRAETPAPLVQLQVANWDPLLAWAVDELGVKLHAVTGIIHEPQPKEALRTLHQMVSQFDPFELAAFHDLVALSGSLIIGLAASRELKPAAALWELSQIDENWQTSQWGEDEEELKKTKIKKQAFLDASTFFLLLRNGIN